LCGLPAVGKQFIELMVREVANAHEQIAEIGEGFDVQALAGGDQGGQSCSRSSALVTPIEEPVVPADHNLPETALGVVVVDLQITVLAVAQQRLPVLQGVVDRIADRALG
jgi:hypothetical protein